MPFSLRGAVMPRLPTCAKMIFYWMTQPMIVDGVSQCVPWASCERVLLPNIHTMMTDLPSNEILVFLYVLFVMLNVWSMYIFIKYELLQLTWWMHVMDTIIIRNYSRPVRWWSLLEQNKTSWTRSCLNPHSGTSAPPPISAARSHRHPTARCQKLQICEVHKQ